MIGVGGSRIIVALDHPDGETALALAQCLAPDLCRVKIGKELFTAAGPPLVEALVGAGFDVFLDLKFHDIPSTVARAVVAAANLGVWMVNVHAAGGSQMMRAAREVLPAGGPLLIAVTVLTSQSQADLDEIGIVRPLSDQVLHLAALARDCALDGVVCAAAEAAAIHRRLGDSFLCVTPGIRTSADAGDDQRRIMTPEGALHAGSDFLVIGRPITRAEDPAAALLAIRQRIADYESGAK